MHAGKVLTQDAPTALLRARSVQTLEEAFIAYLEEDGWGAGCGGTNAPALESAPAPVAAPQLKRWRRFSLRRLWSYAHREAMELQRDPIRLAFALLGPILLMITFGYGISFDVEHLSYAVLDRDHARKPCLSGAVCQLALLPRAATHDALRRDGEYARGTLHIAIEIPPDFGRDLKRRRQPEVGVWLDGAMPFRAETSRGYVEACTRPISLSWPDARAVRNRQAAGRHRGALPLQPGVQERVRHRPWWSSCSCWGLIPTMMTAGVVREKEMGSITNLYVTPVTGLEFLLGKQLPYAALAFASFTSLLLLGWGLFQVPVKGSLAALMVGAALWPRPPRASVCSSRRL